VSVTARHLPLLLLLVAGCERKDPPGRLAGAEPTTTIPRPSALISEATAAPSAAASADTSPEASEPGHGSRLASIAMRTWIYDAPAERARKLGYLRAGALIDRAASPAGTDGCEGGWYRVAPRGYACVGKGATLDERHPIVLAAARGPRRGEPTPYTYVMSDSPPPHMYFRLPKEADQLRVEGPTVKTHAALSKIRFASLQTDEVPQFLLDGNNLPTPYGSEKNLSLSVHRGRANQNSAFGLQSVFDWTDRRFGLTTELDLIPLDRTKPATISKVRGIELKNGGKPAFVVASGTTAYKKDGKHFKEAGAVPGRSGWELTGEVHGGDQGLYETTEGTWLPKPGLIVGEPGKDRAKHAERGKKWISVSIQKQMLIALEGERPVYAALVSTGRGGMSDPAETFATIRGTFLLRAKHVSGTMDGNEAGDESFDLRDVPYIQYFHEGYALHAAYWHDDFGKTRSHGCVNLPPADAAWLFDWTDPQVPAEWHGAVSPQGGTLVYIHK
jgi:hypothetical protein